MTILLRAAALTLTLSIGAALSPAAGAASSEAPKPPANDEVANAQVNPCAAGKRRRHDRGRHDRNGGSAVELRTRHGQLVWYSLHTGSVAQRVAVELAAGGKLDGTIDVYKAVRSQLQPVACQATEEEGKASLTFKAQKNTEYEIRVAALPTSQLAAFTLNVFQPTPAIAPPGPRLPGAGANGQVDRIQNSNAAYSMVIGAVSYLVNLVNETRGGCVNGALSGRGRTASKEPPRALASTAAATGCSPPGRARAGSKLRGDPGPRTQGRAALPPAGDGRERHADHPGGRTGNYRRSSGRLEGSGVQVLRLYRMDVTSHSNLTLRLSAPASAEFNLQLRDQNGGLIACSCSGSGSQKLQQQLRKGHYYAVVSERDHTCGSFTLTRESRTITHTKVAFGAAHGVAGQAVAIKLLVAPAALGPLKVEVQRFDPVFGWEFYGTLEATVSEGTASIRSAAIAGELAGQRHLRGLAYFQPERGGLYLPVRVD